MDHVLEKYRLQKQNLVSKVTALLKSLPKFLNLNVYLSILKRNLPIENEDKKQDRTKQKREIKKKEEYLLEKRINEIETELKSLRASRKEVYKIYNEDVEAF